MIETSSTPGGADERSPPATATPASAAPSPTALAKSRAQTTVVAGSATRVISTDVPTAPMAARSARFWVSSFAPTSEALDHRSSQSRPRTIASVVATTGPEAATTAASSPGPTSKPGCGVKNGKIDPSRPSSDTPARVWAGVIMTSPSWRDGRSTETVASGWPGHRPGWFTRGASPGKPD